MASDAGDSSQHCFAVAVCDKTSPATHYSPYPSVPQHNASTHPTPSEASPRRRHCSTEVQRRLDLRFNHITYLLPADFLLAVWPSPSAEELPYSHVAREHCLTNMIEITVSSSTSSSADKIMRLTSTRRSWSTRSSPRRLDVTQKECR